MALVPLAALVGIDWADQHHDVSLQDAQTATVERRRLPHRPEAIAAWLAELRHRFPDQLVGIAVETSRGPLIHALLESEGVVLYPVNPRSLQRFRETFTPSGAKDDVPDADLLRELLVKHRDRLRCWVPADRETRTLQRLGANRRKLVDLRTKGTQQLMALLKEYFPQALDWAGTDLTSQLACAFLRRWPTLAAVQRARPATVRAFYHRHHCRRRATIARRLDAMAHATPLTTDPAIIEPSALMVQALAAHIASLTASIERADAEIARRFAAHADAALFAALPGSGTALAPRLVAVFGTDRARYPTAADVQQFTGIAPVTERSGQRCWVHWRWAAPTFLRQTLHEYAHHSIRYSIWARAYYARQRARGKTHHAAVRALAFKWIRIIWRCWQDRIPYDEARYLRTLVQRGSPLAAAIQAQAPS
jgi:transposase